MGSENYDLGSDTISSASSDRDMEEDEEQIKNSAIEHAAES